MMLEALSIITSSEPDQAPGVIEFCAYRNGEMLPRCGDDHLMWTVAIDKDHTATVYMHKDDFAVLRALHE